MPMTAKINCPKCKDDVTANIVRAKGLRATVVNVFCPECQDVVARVPIKAFSQVNLQVAVEQYSVEVPNE